MASTQQKIQEVEAEIARTQKNKATEGHLGLLKAKLAKLSGDDITATQLAGEPIIAKLSTAPGNGAPIGGVKVVSESSWFAARPSGTEDVYKIYAESFKGPEHLKLVQAEAKRIVDAAL